MKIITLTAAIVAGAVLITAAQAPESGATDANIALFDAARAGDVQQIEAALASGAAVNATSRYNMTPLMSAAGSGRLAAVKLLVARGADVGARDTFYQFTAGVLAVTNGHRDVALLLLQSGWQGGNDLLLSGVRNDDAPMVTAALATTVTRTALESALKAAEALKRASMVPLLQAKLESLPAAAPLVTTSPGNSSTAPPAVPTDTAKAVAAVPAPVSGVPRSTAPRNWSSFRGDNAVGNGDGQRSVREWDVSTGKNIKWKTAIPGIANSSPIIWGNRIFVTTAVSKTGDKTFRTGLYGDVKPVEDLSEHEWKIYALDKSKGTILWERVAFTGLPKVKRHPKASQANSTPTTDGRRVIAAFGTIGLLIAWDMNGKELWRADLGVLDTGWFLDPSFQWGHSSSPIIHGSTVVLQADMQKGSYIGAWDVATGKQVWRTPRVDELPTWGTPAIVTSATGRSELVTNGTKIRGYDPATGKHLWTLGPNSEITVGTPVVGHGLVFVAGGYPPVRPIYAIRPGGSGDISLPKGATSSTTIAWSNTTDGTYIPTPIVYRGHLITMNNNGVVTFFNAETGERVFRGRVSEGGAFSASPVIADGRLLVASEDGEVYVVSAEPGLAPISRNDMKEVIMATPAISDGVIVIRTLGHVYGIGE